jgi:hypothetical protein
MLILDLQYNALVDHASDGQDSYSGSWIGPAPSSFSLPNQTLALDVLLAGIAVGDPTMNVTGPSPNDTNPPPPHSKSIVGPIVGGCLGGIFLITCILGYILYSRKKKRNAIHAFDPSEPQPYQFTAREDEGMMETSLHRPTLPSTTKGTSSTTSNAAWFPQSIDNRSSMSPSSGLIRSEPQFPQSPVQVPSSGARSQQDLTAEELVDLLNSRLRDGNVSLGYLSHNGNPPPDYRQQEHTP